MKTTLLALSIVCMTGTVWSQQSADPSPTPAAQTTSSVSWLIGSWVFDEEYTQQKHAELQKNRGSVSAEANLSSQLIDKMKGAKVEVTDSQVTTSRSDGTSKSQKYTAAEGSDGNTAQLKQENGETLAFHKDGERMWMTSTGSVNEPFYFKKAQ